MKPKRNYKLIDFDMIFVWDVKAKPFVSQKLRFKAPPKFKLAYQEAQELINLLARSGGLKESQVKLVAVAATGALEEFQAENAPFLLRQANELKKRSAEIKAMGLTDKKSVGPMVKVKSSLALDMTLNAPRAPVTLIKMPKANVAAPLEAMYDARKDSTKAESKSSKATTDQAQTSSKANKNTKTSPTKVAGTAGREEARATEKGRTAASAKSGVATRSGGKSNRAKTKSPARK